MPKLIVLKREQILFVAGVAALLATMLGWVVASDYFRVYVEVGDLPPAREINRSLLWFIAVFIAVTAGAYGYYIYRAGWLRRAISESRIDAAIQPIVSLADGNILAYEALARINDDRGPINASRFIPLAEKSGLAKDLDMAVLHRGLSLIHGLPEGTKMFFNFSKATLCDARLMVSLPDVIRRAGVCPCQVVIEITEREALPDLAAMKSIVEALSATGIEFAIDDFGSGFSSYLYLRDLNIHYLKIEGAFVQHMARSHRDRLIVENIHQVAQQLGLYTIAEFVEDKETVTLLAKIGIDCIQGHYFGHAAIVRPAVR